VLYDFRDVTTTTSASLTNDDILLALNGCVTPGARGG
jgi:hypothetical protein